MKNKDIFLFLLSGIITFKSYALPGDTIVISQKDVNTKVLRQGTSLYLVYFKMKKDSVRTMTQFWTRTIAREKYNGQDAITVYQSWEDKDSIMHTTKSVSDTKTFAPLYQDSWWKRNGKVISSSYDFVSKKAIVDGLPLTDADTAKNRKASWLGFSKALDQYTLNWHLDLEVFPIMPYKTGRTFGIPFYDPGFSAPRTVYYTVTGEDRLQAYDDQIIDCWLLEHTDKQGREVFWISKKTNEVLKLEQQLAGTMWRYKVKLEFSR